MMRLLRIALACVLASLASGFGLILLLSLGRDWLAAGLEGVMGALEVMAVAGLFASAAIGMVALLPAALFIVLAELTRLRSAAIYGAAGMLAAIVGERVLISDPYPSQLLLVSAAGLLAGLVYWWIAGRTAGARRHSLS
jgi:hypothetical protein